MEEAEVKWGSVLPWISPFMVWMQIDFFIYAIPSSSCSVPFLPLRACCPFKLGTLIKFTPLLFTLHILWFIESEALWEKSPSHYWIPEDHQPSVQATQPLEQASAPAPSSILLSCTRMFPGKQISMPTCSILEPSIGLLKGQPEATHTWAIEERPKIDTCSTSAQPSQTVWGRAWTVASKPGQQVTLRQ